MGVAAILVTWPGPFEHSFVPPSHGGSIWNLTLIGQAVSEEKTFKECGRQRRTDNGACLHYKLTYEPKGSGDLTRNEPPHEHDKTYKMTCAPSEDRSARASAKSDQFSLSAWRNLGPLATHWLHSEDWSDCMDGSLIPSLRWAHII